MRAVELEDDEAAAFLANPAVDPGGLNTSNDTSNEVNDISFAAGFVLVGFALYSLRIPLVPWLWNGIGLRYFIPVVSPVYREGEHWQAPYMRTAILCHISFGVMMLALATVQADKVLRRNHPQWHRYSGRAYIFCGLMTIGSLQVLQPSVGAGSSSTPSTALALFVDLTSIGWLCATFVGAVAARARRIELHKNCMRCSIALAATPIGQRAYSWVLCAPLAMAVRVLVCTGGDVLEPQVPWDRFFSIRWGAPLDTLWGDGCVIEDTDLVMLRTRERPLVMSLDGYGEGEQASFALSAWLSLISMVVLSLSPWLIPAAKPPKKDFISFGEIRLFEAWRAIGADLLRMLQNQQRDRNKGWTQRILWWTGLVVFVAAFVVFGIAAAIPVFVIMTVVVTVAVFTSALAAAAIAALGLHIGKMLFGHAFVQTA